MSRQVSIPCDMFWQTMANNSTFSEKNRKGKSTIKYFSQMFSFTNLTIYFNFVNAFCDNKNLKVPRILFCLLLSSKLYHFFGENMPRGNHCQYTSVFF